MLMIKKLLGIKGIARIFQRGVTLCQSEGTHQIIISFSSPVVGCLLKKDLQKGGGGGHGHPRTPLATPLLGMTLGRPVTSQVD